MIELYYWPTPNGHKIAIFLEEAGLEYKIVPVNIGKGDQFTPEYLKINPNSKMPAIIDSEGPEGKPFSLFESGAILIYLGDKTGKFLPRSGPERYRTIEWLMWQMGGVGPMLGQAGHFHRAAPEKIPYAIERYDNESRRLQRVMDKRLGEVPFLAGEYSVADIATFPWIRSRKNMNPDNWDEMPNLKRWFETIEARPAVQRGVAVGADLRSAPKS